MWFLLQAYFWSSNIFCIILYIFFQKKKENNSRWNSRESMAHFVVMKLKTDRCERSFISTRYVDVTTKTEFLIDILSIFKVKIVSWFFKKELVFHFILRTFDIISQLCMNKCLLVFKCSYRHLSKNSRFGVSWFCKH